MDREAFLVKLPHGRSYLLKAHKPASWVSCFEESIKEAEQCCNCQGDRERSIAPNFEGNVSGLDALHCVVSFVVCVVLHTAT